MQVSIENLEDLQRCMKVTLPRADYDSKLEQQFAELSKNKKLRVPGFRAGKVPLNVIKQQFAGRVHEDTCQRLIQESFQEALKQQDVNPVAMPQFSTDELKENEDFCYSATFEVYPTIELQDNFDLNIEKVICEVSDEDVEETLTDLRKRDMQWNEVDEKAASGHRVVIDFKGFMDGEEAEGTSAESHALELGSGSMIPGFEDGIMGASKGDELTLDLSFPEDYHHNDYAGKAVQFKIHVHKVEAGSLPELDAEFAKKYGVQDGDIAKLREETKQGMERELNTYLRTKLHKKVLDNLLEAHQFPVPKALLQNELQRLMEQMKQNPYSVMELLQGGDGNFEQATEKRISRGLLLNEIIQKFEIKADNDLVNKFMDEHIQAYDNPDQMRQELMANNNAIGHFQEQALEQQAIDKILESAKVEEVNKSYTDVMRKREEI